MPVFCLKGGIYIYLSHQGIYIFPGGSDSKESICHAGDLGLIPGSRRSPGEENGNLLQYSCLKNSMDRGARRATVHGGAWWATVHGVTKSWTRQSNWTRTRAFGVETPHKYKEYLLKLINKHTLLVCEIKLTDTLRKGKTTNSFSFKRVFFLKALRSTSLSGDCPAEEWEAQVAQW